MNAEDRQPASTIGDRGTATGPIGTRPDATGSAHHAAVRRRLLEDGRARGLYSGATWSLGDAAGPYDRGWTGTRSLDGPALDGHDLWDLASVTKPMVGLVVMALVDRGVVGLDDTVGHHLTRYSNSPHAARTVAQLLDHTAGLPGGVPLYRDHPTRESLLTALGSLPRTAEPGTHVTYSSQGFMLLGLMAEQATGQGLDQLMTDLVSAPLGLTDTRFRPESADRARAVATEACPWRGRTVVGEVHDENAVVLGGVAGHAGLFSTLADLERLAVSLLGGGPPLLKADTLALMTAPAPTTSTCAAHWPGRGRTRSVRRWATPSARPRTATRASPARACGSTRRTAATRSCSRTASIPAARSAGSRRCGGTSTRSEGDGGKCPGRWPSRPGSSVSPPGSARPGR